MSAQSFSLVPFPVTNIPDITIHGSIAREGNILVLHYTLAGDLEDIFLPAPSAKPGRKDELWKSTCFEFFVAVNDQPQYWEFNMSPSGDWNIYYMGAYRRVDFRQETAITDFPFEMKMQHNGYSVDASFELTPIIAVEQELQVAIAAVVQVKDGTETYWALIHPALQADFHLRESFILTLAGQPHLSKQSLPGS